MNKFYWNQPKWVLYLSWNSNKTYYLRIVIPWHPLKLKLNLNRVSFDEWSDINFFSEREFIFWSKTNVKCVCELTPPPAPPHTPIPIHQIGIKGRKMCRPKCTIPLGNKIFSIIFPTYNNPNGVASLGGIFRLAYISNSVNFNGKFQNCIICLKNWEN